jgi:uncharacterized lipoprotein YajG
MWKNLKKPIIRNNSNKYKKELSREDIEIFEKVAGSTLIEYGYKVGKNGRANAQFSQEQLKDFEFENQMLKTKIRNKQSSDLKKRSEREKLIMELTAKHPNNSNAN